MNLPTFNFASKRRLLFEIFDHLNTASPTFNIPGNIYIYKELDIDNKLHEYLKITGILNNVFRPQKLLRKQE